MTTPQEQTLRSYVESFNRHDIEAVMAHFVDDPIILDMSGTRHEGLEHGYDPRQSPGLGYKRVVSCKDSFHGTDVLAVSEHGAPGRRPNIHAHVVGRQREDGFDTPSARAAEANRSTLIADIPFPALETSPPSGARAKNERSESVQGS